MACNLKCNELLKNIALGFSVLLSDKKFLSVTVFDSPLNAVKTRIRLTQNIYKKCPGNQKYGSITVSIGKLNYREREFLAKCKKAKTNPKKYWINKIQKRLNNKQGSKNA